ncbi:MAG: S46 family peptidase [Planctomycetia bacterium]
MPPRSIHRGYRLAVAAAVLVASSAAGLRADEGMWTFDAPPLERLSRDHGFAPKPDWLRHLQQASVRFSSGGSGSFVSPDGLVLTNHHVAAGALQKLGDEAHDYYRDGFAAATRADELKCHDLELNVLVSIEDVTARVQAAVEPGMPADRAFAARRAAMAAIEKESLAATGLRSDVVTLFQGAAYHLYRAKRYTDVRLVFAPEHAIAFFGGDADNFEFPRYNLDICFVRAYEDGEPARVPHHLAWGRQPVAAGDLVFVSGHPGHTDRAKTLAEIVALRDRHLPLDLQSINRLESLYAAFCALGPEERRQAAGGLFGAQNGRKARGGILAALLDPGLIATKRETETATRERIEAGLDGRPSPYRRIEEAQADLDRIAVRHRILEGAAGFNSRFFAHARTLLRAAAERKLPDGERLREYRDANRGPLELQLFSDEPLYDGFETAKLADSLTFLAPTLGPDDPLVQAVLAGRPPRTRAAELVAGTALGRRPPAREGGAARADRRRALYDGGAAAVAASDDPMLALARIVDDESRALRQVAEAAQEVKQQAHAEITRARFAHEGKAMYPDATFTLRLASGIVKGIDGAGPEDCPAITTYAGLFARARSKGDAPPFNLPPRWEALAKELEADAAFLATPFNFASTADIIGGNSGSPVVNRAGELVGLIFDGNIHSLRLDLVYDDRLARAVSVDAAGILAALRRVYAAEALVAEIEGAR